MAGLDPQQSLYVYYKVAPEQGLASAKRVREFQHQLRQTWPALQVQLLQRPLASASAQETWMEVYQYPGGVTNEMVQAIQQLASNMGLPEPRANEIFIALGHRV